MTKITSNGSLNALNIDISYCVSRY